MLQKVLKLMEMRRRSLLFLGTLWGSQPGKISMVPSSASMVISGRVMGSVVPGNSRGLYSWYGFTSMKSRSVIESDRLVAWR